MKHILLALNIFTTLMFASCTSKPQPAELVTLSGDVQGTTYNIKYYPLKNFATADEIRNGIQQVFSAVDKSMSTYRNDSTITRFNNFESTEWFEIDPHFYRVLQLSKDIHSETRGAFDITVYPLVQIWGFGKRRDLTNQDQVPTPAQIKNIMSLVGMEKIQIQHEKDKNKYYVRKTKIPTKIDLSAIAQGYTSDLIALFLQQNQIQDYLIDVGGEIRTSGNKADNQQWTIAIESPDVESSSYQKIIQLKDISVATSGNYRNYFEKNGKRYSHILDPQTGRPIEHNLASVTVLDKSCARADGLATGLLVLGTEAAIQLAEQKKLAIFLIYKDHGIFKTYSSPTLEQLLKQN